MIIIINQMVLCNYSSVSYTVKNNGLLFFMFVQLISNTKGLMRRRWMVFRYRFINFYCCQFFLSLMASILLLFIS